MSIRPAFDGARRAEKYKRIETSFFTDREND
jgi:hypothetical protein